MTEVLILSTAGSGVGYGHAIRMSALQKSFNDNGVECRHFIQCMSPQDNFKLDSAYSMDWLNNPNQIISLKGVAETVVIDSYECDYEYYKLLGEIFPLAVAVDDYNRLNYPVGLIINPNLYCDELDYSQQSAEVLGGAAYVILRKLIKTSRIHYKLKKDVGAIMITLGGFDQQALLPSLIQNLSNASAKLTVLAGSDEYAADLRLKFSSEIEIKGLLNEAEMAEAYLNQDLVISAAGQTLNELAYIGIPTIAICTGEDQRSNLNAFYKKGFIADLLDYNTVDFLNLIEDRINYYQDYAARASVHQLGRALIDGAGASRIFKKITEVELNV